MKNFFLNIFKRNLLSQVSRKAGYVKDQKGIQNRFLRENQNWASHLLNTKQYILETVSRLEKRDSIALLGSGWLLDIPLKELSEMFSEVYLYDIVHPQQIVVRTRNMQNVHLIQCDITGGAVGIAEQSSSFDEFLVALSTTTALDLSCYDCVVSVNLLNQLDILLCDYLTEKFHQTKEQLQRVRTIIQQQHVDLLPRHKTCLITDYREKNISTINNTIETKSLLFCRFPEYNNEKQWDWIFDTQQMYHKNQNTILKVKAVNF